MVGATRAASIPSSMPQSCASSRAVTGTVYELAPFRLLRSAQLGPLDPKAKDLDGKLDQLGAFIDRGTVGAALTVVDHPPRRPLSRSRTPLRVHAHRRSSSPSTPSPRLRLRRRRRRRRLPALQPRPTTNLFSSSSRSLCAAAAWVPSASVSTRCCSPTRPAITPTAVGYRPHRGWKHRDRRKPLLLASQGERGLGLGSELRARRATVGWSLTSDVNASSRHSFVGFDAVELRRQVRYYRKWGWGIQRTSGAGRTRARRTPGTPIRADHSTPSGSRNEACGSG